jgi:hypothetical protein
MEAVVDEPLGDILGGAASGLFQRWQIKDAFVGDASVGACIERGEVVAEPAVHVVGREYRH